MSRRVNFSYFLGYKTYNKAISYHITNFPCILYLEEQKKLWGVNDKSSAISYGMKFLKMLKMQQSQQKTT